MNQQGYVRMHDERYDDPPGEHGGPTVVQHTTLNIITEPPKDYIIWSVLSFFYCNFCCLGLLAFLYSIKARDRKVAGDLYGAQRHGETARQFNIATTVIVSLMLLIFLIIIISLSLN